MKTYIIVDIEANGPIPGDYSMTSLGAVIVDANPTKVFTVNIKPISEKVDPSRNQFVDTKNAVDAKVAMEMFKRWIIENAKGKPVFVSDNNGFDWMFVCWYFWHFLNENLFGYYSENMQSILRGIRGDMSAKISDLREQELTHIAQEDAIDNAKIFSSLLKKLNK